MFLMTAACTAGSIYRPEYFQSPGILQKEGNTMSATDIATSVDVDLDLIYE